MKSETSVVDALLLLQAFESLDDPYYEPDAERLRAQVPRSILKKHDLRRRNNHRSISSVTGSLCGHCNASLSAELLKPMRISGSLGVCPKCDGFLYAAATPAVC
jgi:predicted  nucleic acid-binding Zn-ribbon protein